MSGEEPYDGIIRIERFKFMVVGVAGVLRDTLSTSLELIKGVSFTCPVPSFFQFFKVSDKKILLS